MGLFDRFKKKDDSKKEEKPHEENVIPDDLEIDDDIIKPGDFVFGDQNGVVVIPKELFHETMVATFNVKVKESHIIKELKKGRLLSEIIGLNR